MYQTTRNNENIAPATNVISDQRESHGAIGSNLICVTNVSGMQVNQRQEQPCSSINNNNRQMLSGWVPPERGKLKINIDASFIDASTNAGIGLILRNHAGACLGARGAMAVREAYRWAEEQSMGNVIIEGDASNIINFLNNKNIAPSQNFDWRVVNILHNLSVLNSSSNNYLFVKVTRTANRPADVLAKAARLWVGRETWDELDIPSFLFDVLSNLE